MNLRKSSIIVLGAFLWFHVCMAGGESIECIHMYDQLSERNQSNEKKYILMKGAFQNNGCLSPTDHSLKNAKELDIKGWTVLYGAGDHVEGLKQRVNNNLDVFMRKYDSSSFSDDRKYIDDNQKSFLSRFELSSYKESNFVLSSFDVFFKSTCNVLVPNSLIPNQSKKIARTWAPSSVTITQEEYCLSIPVILGVYGVELVSLNDNQILYREVTEKVTEGLKRQKKVTKKR